MATTRQQYEVTSPQKYFFFYCCCCCCLMLDFLFLFLLNSIFLSLILLICFSSFYCLNRWAHINLTGNNVISLCYFLHSFYILLRFVHFFLYCFFFLTTFETLNLFLLVRIVFHLLLVLTLDRVVSILVSELNIVLYFSKAINFHLNLLVFLLFQCCIASIVKAIRLCIRNAVIYGLVDGNSFFPLSFVIFFYVSSSL